jgi:hypothetical protein
MRSIFVPNFQNARTINWSSKLSMLAGKSELDAKVTTEVRPGLLSASIRNAYLISDSDSKPGKVLIHGLSDLPSR